MPPIYIFSAHPISVLFHLMTNSSVIACVLPSLPCLKITVLRGYNDHDGPRKYRMKNKIIAWRNDFSKHKGKKNLEAGGDAKWRSARLEIILVGDKW